MAHATGIEHMFVHRREKVKEAVRPGEAAWDDGSMRATVAIALIGLVALAGCGGGDDSTDAEEIPGGADQEAAEVIRDWADDLRGGDLEAAADHFRLPSIAQNGTAPIQLTTRDDVRAFNASLPCGAELTEAEDHGRFVIATFELTERPGEGECGTGVGEFAKTAFVIEDGLITRWIRVVDEDEELAPPAEGPVV
jgi:hypothetical protein